MLEQVEQYLTDNATRCEDELKEFLRIPSISAQSQHKPDMQRAAEFVRDRLAEAGLTAEIVPTAGFPIVYAEWLGAGENAPTALVYGHYDVQPPEPLEDWITPPFEPTVRDGCIYARGATDDKGQSYTHIKSVEAWIKTHSKLPINVKFVIEGEEEVGGANLDVFLEANKDRCRCDVAVISDTSQYAPGMPAITYGLRGILACEVTVHGPSRDLHSGMFGGSIANPVNSLAAMIGVLHDDNGRIQIPGFYDDIIPLTEAERKRLAALPFDEAKYINGLNVSAVWGEADFTTLERRWGRPTCDVNGMWGGYLGEGPKTIIPSKATAKITCRLVPNQNSKQLTAALEQFLRSKMRPGLRMEFKSHHGAGGILFDPDSPTMNAAKAAITRSFGVEPVLIREGGSIPVVTAFHKLLGVETLLLGWGQDTDNLHSPNEHFSLADFHRGIRASAALWQELAAR